MAATTLSPTRALRQPRRFDGRALVGLFLTAVSVFGALFLWSATSGTRGVLVATRDRPAGTLLADNDLAVARVRVDDDIYRAAIPESERKQLTGRPLAEPVHAQQVLVRAQFASRPPLAPDHVAMTIPLSADVAPGLRLRPGDAVQVIATLNKGTPNPRTETAVERAVVYDVAYEERRTTVSPELATGGTGADLGGRRGPGAPITITLAVTTNEAGKLASARWNGSLDVVILPPEATPRP